MQITEATKPSKVAIELCFEKPFKARNETEFSIQANGEGSLVTWAMTGQKTLMTKVMGIFVSMEKFLGPDFEKGLARLKAQSERAAG